MTCAADRRPSTGRSNRSRTRTDAGPRRRRAIVAFALGTMAAMLVGCGAPKTKAFDLIVNADPSIDRLVTIDIAGVGPEHPLVRAEDTRYWRGEDDRDPVRRNPLFIDTVATLRLPPDAGGSMTVPKSDPMIESRWTKWIVDKSEQVMVRAAVGQQPVPGSIMVDIMDDSYGRGVEQLRITVTRDVVVVEPVRKARP